MTLRAHQLTLLPLAFPAKTSIRFNDLPNEFAGVSVGPEITTVYPPAILAIRYSTCGTGDYIIVRRKTSQDTWQPVPANRQWRDTATMTAFAYLDSFSEYAMAPP